MEKTFNPWYYYVNDILIKNKKPIVPGMQVHLHSMEGCYTVHFADTKGFYIMKNRKEVKRPWSDFRCLKGEGPSLESRVKRIISSIDIIKEQIKNLIK